jgi:hypothetical protein
VNSSNAFIAHSFYANGNVNFSNNVNAASFSGNGGNLSNIAVGNITGLGNIATINLDGNASNILYGNGVFATPATQSILANGTSNVSIPSANGNINFSANNNSNLVQISADTNALVNVFPLITQTNALRFNSIGSPQQDCRITFARYETNVANSTSVQPNANVGTLIFFAHNGTGLSTTLPAIIRAKVDAAYTANTANIPYGLQFIVAQTTQTGTANTGFSHNFWSNGNVSFAKTVNAANIILSGNANITGTANITGNSNVGNLGASGLITATGNITGGNLLTNGLLDVKGNVTLGNASSNSFVTITGDKTVNSSVSLVDTQFAVALSNVNTSGGFSPFRFNQYTSLSSQVGAMFFQRARGNSFANQSPVLAGDEVAVFNFLVNSNNVATSLNQISSSVTYNDNAGNIGGRLTLDASGVGTTGQSLSKIELTSANINVSGNINITGNAIVNSNTTIYSNGLVNATQFSTANTNIYANGAVNTNGELTADNVKIDTNGFMKLSSYTAAALTAITGQIGWMAAVSDSASGGNPNGMIAFWDTTNARWSYVHDNSAV